MSKFLLLLVLLVSMGCEAPRPAVMKRYEITKISNSGKTTLMNYILHDQSHNLKVVVENQSSRVHCDRCGDLGHAVNAQWILEIVPSTEYGTYCAAEESYTVDVPVLDIDPENTYEQPDAEISRSSSL